MEAISVINLIQAGTVTVGILGSVLLWRVRETKGIALLLGLIALASFVNILEETGLTRDFHLISPAFIMLFGPATYLATKFAVTNDLNKRDYWHLLPVLPALVFTSYIYTVIALGTLWRLAYTFFTASILIKYKKQLDEQRSDSDEYSLNWLIGLLVVLTFFNLVDLLRLNLQPVLAYELNILGQGINNLVWLIATMVIIYQFSSLNGLPKPIRDQIDSQHTASRDDDYKAIYQELDKLITENQWYLTPRLTLANINELTGIQTRDISRAINIHTNQSFNEYINRFRVQAVCNILQTDQDISLTQSAYDAGFSSKASFNKVFKQVIGKTPSDYKSSL